MSAKFPKPKFIESDEYQEREIKSKIISDKINVKSDEAGLLPPHGGKVEKSSQKVGNFS